MQTSQRRRKHDAAAMESYTKEVSVQLDIHEDVDTLPHPTSQALSNTTQQRVADASRRADCRGVLVESFQRFSRYETVALLGNIFLALQLFNEAFHLAPDAEATTTECPVQDCEATIRRETHLRLRVHVQNFRLPDPPTEVAPAADIAEEGSADNDPADDEMNVDLLQLAVNEFPELASVTQARQVEAQSAAYVNELLQNIQQLQSQLQEKTDECTETAQENNTLRADLQAAWKKQRNLERKLAAEREQRKRDEKLHKESREELARAWESSPYYHKLYKDTEKALQQALPDFPAKKRSTNVLSANCAKMKKRRRWRSPNLNFQR
ncbi:hypothetical protein U1Q18_052238 [Sarracenia purpurea var. burkii]